jgi:hypothetical protein
VPSYAIDGVVPVVDPTAFVHPAARDTAAGVPSRSRSPAVIIPVHDSINHLLGEET